MEHRKFSHHPQILDRAEARIEAFHKSTSSERCLPWPDVSKPGGLFTASFFQPDLLIANKAGVYPSAFCIGVS